MVCGDSHIVGTVKLGFKWLVPLQGRRGQVKADLLLRHLQPDVRISGDCVASGAPNSMCWDKTRGDDAHFLTTSTVRLSWSSACLRAQGASRGCCVVSLLIDANR